MALKRIHKVSGWRNVTSISRRCGCAPYWKYTVETKAHFKKFHPPKQAGGWCVDVSVDRPSQSAGNKLFSLYLSHFVRREPARLWRWKYICVASTSMVWRSVVIRHVCGWAHDRIELKKWGRGSCRVVPRLCFQSELFRWNTAAVLSETTVSFLQKGKK